MRKSFFFVTSFIIFLSSPWASHTPVAVKSLSNRYTAPTLLPGNSSHLLGHNLISKPSVLKQLLAIYGDSLARCAGLRSSKAFPQAGVEELVQDFQNRICLLRTFCKIWASSLLAAGLGEVHLSVMKWTKGGQRIYLAQGTSSLRFYAPCNGFLHTHFPGDMTLLTVNRYVSPDEPASLS